MKRIALLSTLFFLVTSCSSEVTNVIPVEQINNQVNAQGVKPAEKNLFAKYAGFIAKDTSGKLVLEIEKKDFFGVGKAKKTKDVNYIYSSLEHGFVPTWKKNTVKGNTFIGKDGKLYLNYTAAKTYIVLGDWQKITDLKVGQKINFNLDSNLKLSFTDTTAIIENSGTDGGKYYPSQDKPELL